LPRYHAALRRLLIAFDALDPALKPWFNFAPGFRTTIQKHIEMAEAILAQLPTRPRPDASRNKAAVSAAYDLLTSRGHPAPTTRGGRWEQLANILAGNRTVDLFDHLRRFKQTREKMQLEGKDILSRLRGP
jgi:hypothetical protein